MTRRGLPGYVEGKTFDVYSCDHCDTKTVFPRQIDDGVYNAIYANLKLLPGYWRYGKYADEARRVVSPLDYLADQEDMYWAVRQCLHDATLDGKRPRVLEVGSGRFPDELRGGQLRADGTAVMCTKIGKESCSERE